MGIASVADQFRKWRRNSTNRDTLAPSSIIHRHIEIPYQNGQYIPDNTNGSPGHPGNQQKIQAQKTAPAKQYPPSPDTQLNGIGDYTFVKQVGQGKFSRVMLSYHCLTKQQVAVKIIDKRIHDYRVMSRLVREISLMEALDHPNIVKLYETYETTDSLYLVMEYIDGFNLDEFLKQKGGRISENKARDIFRQMTAAMDYCHSRWVVHRDLKAPNILLTKNLQVKIADFGLGNRFGRRRLKTICGSMLYYSPEIINGHGYVGPEIDCWCLGVSLYRMTVGEEPFSRAKTVGDLRKDVTAGNFVVPTSLSVELRDTIIKCMSIDKHKRSRIHIALKNDSWLTDNGKYPDVFEYNSQTDMGAAVLLDDNETTRLKKEKERMKHQYLRDMEEEKRSKKCINRTIICHPKNPSIYFTSAVLHSPKPEDTFTNSETQRLLLFQKVKELSHLVQLSPAHKAVKSPIRHLLRKLRQSDNNGNPINNMQSTSFTMMNDGTNSQVLAKSSSSNLANIHNRPLQRTIVHKSASNMSLSQIYQRVTKDQVHYYTFQLTQQIAMQFFGVDILPVSLQDSQQDYQQDESTMMLIARGICDMMGITYYRDKSDRLICVMALSDYIQERPKSFYSLKRRDSKMLSSKQSLSFNSSQGSFGKSSVGQSDMNRSSNFSSKFKKLTSHVLSSIFPYHSSTLVIQDNSRFTHTLPIPGINKNRASVAGGLSQSSQSSHKTTNNGHEEELQDKKPGVARFAIEIQSLSKENNIPQQQQHRIVAIKLSKIEGSSKVFRIACGWITGVIGQNITPAQLSDNLNALMITNTISGSADIPSMTQTKHRMLSRPKSIIALSSMHPTSKPSDLPPQTLPIAMANIRDNTNNT